MCSPSSNFAVLYERLGTKGLVLKRGKIVREIDRSFYHANDYEYPITLFQLPDGREVLAHCPDSYNQLDLEDIETGQRLTEAPERKPADYFFSRLISNAAGTWLLSAGWVWQPWDLVALYNVPAALRDPHTLDEQDTVLEPYAEVSYAAFASEDRLVLATSSEPVDAEATKPIQLWPNSLGIYDLAERQLLSSVRLTEPAGTIMPIGQDKVVSCYRHPKLINLNTGEILHH